MLGRRSLSKSEGFTALYWQAGAHKAVHHHLDVAVSFLQYTPTNSLSVPIALAPSENKNQPSFMLSLISSLPGPTSNVPNLCPKVALHNNSVPSEPRSLFWSKKEGPDSCKTHAPKQKRRTNPSMRITAPKRKKKQNRNSGVMSQSNLSFPHKSFLGRKKVCADPVLSFYCTRSLLLQPPTIACAFTTLPLSKTISKSASLTASTLCAIVITVLCFNSSLRTCWM